MRNHPHKETFQLAAVRLDSLHVAVALEGCADMLFDLAYLSGRILAVLRDLTAIDSIAQIGSACLVDLDLQKLAHTVHRFCWIEAETLERYVEDLVGRNRLSKLVERVDLVRPRACRLQITRQAECPRPREDLLADFTARVVRQMFLKRDIAPVSDQVQVLRARKRVRQAGADDICFGELPTPKPARRTEPNVIFLDGLLKVA